MSFTELGVCVLGEAAENRARTVSYPRYVFEILAHAGVFYTAFTLPELEENLDDLRVLVTVGEADLTESLKAKLTAWVNAGGMWLSVGGIGGLDALLGLSRIDSTFKNWGGGLRSLGEGYLVATQTKHPLLAHLNRPLHYFGGAAIEAKGATVLARRQRCPRAPDGPAAVARKCEWNRQMRFHRRRSDRHGRPCAARSRRDSRRRAFARWNIPGKRWRSQKR